MILTEIGEIGITVGDQHYKLRPSLYAMTQLGTPSEIVELYSSLMSDCPEPDQFEQALAVVHACCDADLSSVFGYFGAGEESGKLEYVAGVAQKDDVLPLAKSLITHGVVGALPELPRKPDQEPEFVREFDARAHVSLAIAHLSMSSTDAWNMTMTELVGALRAKFPPAAGNSPGSRAPTSEEHEQTMDWYDQVEAKRKAKLKLH